MRLQDRARPNEDPGDLSITWQDDSLLVSLEQGGQTFLAGTADEALDELMIYLAAEGRI